MEAPDRRALPYGISSADVYAFQPRTGAGECAEGEFRAAMVRSHSLGLGARGSDDDRSAPPAGGPTDRRDPELPIPPPVDAACRREAGGGDRQELMAALGEGRPPPAAGADDARTLSIRIGEDGQMHRDFRDSIEMSKKVEFGDWPVRGPRSTPWLVRQLSEGVHTPIAHHARFVSFLRMPVFDPPSRCSTRRGRAYYKRWSATTRSTSSTWCRQLQLLEDRDYQLPDKAATSAAAEESSMYMGRSTAHGGVVSPDLKDWIAGELAREASVLKERRKAREERAPAALMPTTVMLAITLAGAGRSSPIDHASLPGPPPRRSVVFAGMTDSHLHRDLLPLPIPVVTVKSSPVSRKVLRRSARCLHAQEWMAGGIRALNELGGDARPPPPLAGAAQQPVWDYIGSVYCGGPQ